MRRFTRASDSKQQTTRQPIPLSSAEEESLRQYAESEKRSKSAMAGIIYRMGVETYEARLHAANRNK